MCGACEPLSRILSRRRSAADPTAGIIIYLGRSSPIVSSNLPAPRFRRAAILRRDGVRDACGATGSCTPWGLPGRAGHPVAPVRSYRTLSPLTCAAPEGTVIGGTPLCSTCHSRPGRSFRRERAGRGLPVRKHGALWCSDFPHRRLPPTERLSGSHARSPASRARQAPLSSTITRSTNREIPARIAPLALSPLHMLRAGRAP